MRNNRFFFSALIILVLILVVTMVGCSNQSITSSAPSVSNPSRVPATSASTKPAQVYNLKFSFHEPAESLSSVHALLPWARSIETATGGRVKIQDYPDQTLAKGTDQWQAVKTGIADIGWCFMGYWPGQTPLSDVVSLPFLPFKSAEQASSVLWQLYQKYPQIQIEYKDCKVITLFTSDPYFLITAKKQIKTLEDLSGLKLRITGGPPTDAMKALGASPIMVAMNDLYVTLKEGSLDGAAVDWAPIDSNRLFEFTKYYTYVPLYVVYFAMVMNWNTWNSLPADIQKQIETAGGGLEAARFLGKNFFDSASSGVPEKIRKAGYEVNEYTIPSAEVDRWATVSSSSYNSWSDKLKGGPVDPAALIKDVQSLIQSTK